ncbi:hypothetical protein C9374_001448 [Naegleria lovaniensis]|uniref:GMP phosphodiesterase delta subunit domain-containing protein n=1 Tax=Naegleria lovaniensis TaxID=51637 RepID=A0AA88GXE6_NAELO|nr:uncharacterized protein C9374_001448 [Naegleria lovaniensis]KAG2387854.1 hypothetical protein C9374_001448 [Naegleria lovaniensis]
MTSQHQHAVLKIEKMKMASKSKILWESDWSAGLPYDNNKGEIAIKIPKEILKCQQVQREIVFSCSQPLKNLSLVQLVKLNGNDIERWDFDFGFVIPNSVNSWESVIEAAKEGTIGPEVLSGNVTIDTAFYDGDNLVASNRVRVYYV